MRHLAGALLVLLAFPVAARADGKVFGRAVARVGMPDQAALLLHEEGRETLVIEPAFVGDGEEFAWLVPLPAVPEVEPATRGLFPTLRAIFRPRVRGGESRAFPAVLPFWLLALLGAGIFWKVRHRVAWHWFFLIVLLPFLALCLLALVLIVPSGLSASLGSRTLVEAHRIVGSYETATLAGEAVPEWLETHGFRVPDEAAPVLEAYASEGWVTFAAKLRVDPATGREHRAHPLRFDFESDRPVYPLRLTGVGGEPLRLDLFVFGERRAEAAGLELARAGSTIPVVHPGLGEIVGQRRFGTKLTGTLPPESMRRDLEITWSDEGEFDPVYFTPRLANSLAANAMMICILLGTVSLAWVVSFGRIGRFGVLVWLAVSMLAGLLLAAALRGLLPTREVDYELPAGWIHQRFLSALEADYDDWEGVGLNEARRRLRESLGEEVAAAEEDSPGRYVLRERDGGIEYVVFDEDGAPVPHRLGSKG